MATSKIEISFWGARYNEAVYLEVHDVSYELTLKQAKKLRVDLDEAIANAKGA